MSEKKPCPMRSEKELVQDFERAIKIANLHDRLTRAKTELMALGFVCEAGFVMEAIEVFNKDIEYDIATRKP